MIAGTVFGISGPAAADPSVVTTIAGAGSDTTQDVMDAIAYNLVSASTTVGSWDASVGGVVHDPITPKGRAACTNISRPDGSIEGVTALRLSLSGTPIPGGGTYPNARAVPYPTGPGSSRPIYGSLCFDFARTSIPGPGSTEGLLQYVPFGLDGVTMAVGPASGTNATAINGAFDLAELRSMYGLGRPAVASDGVTYDPDPSDGVTGTPIHLLIPQPGSGDRRVIAANMSINADHLPPWVTDTFVPTAGGPAQSVQENDGTPVLRDHNAIMPFSIAQWIGQAKGHNDRRDGARLQTVDSIAPIVSAKLNTAFPGALLHEVYNVIPFASTTATGTPLYNVFVSDNTASPLRLCSQSGVISEYGFGLLDTAPKGHVCGQIAGELRAFGPTEW